MTALHTFEGIPPVGTILMLDAQAFEMIGTEPYVRKTDGETITLIVWRARCPAEGCGALFEAKTTCAVHMVRRCPEHKARGVTIGKPWGKATVTVRAPEAIPHP